MFGPDDAVRPVFAFRGFAFRGQTRHLVSSALLLSNCWSKQEGRSAFLSRTRILAYGSQSIPGLSCARLQGLSPNILVCVKLCERTPWDHLGGPMVGVCYLFCDKCTETELAVGSWAGEYSTLSPVAVHLAFSTHYSF